MSRYANFHGVQAVAIHDAQLAEIIKPHLPSYALLAAILFMQAAVIGNLMQQNAIAIERAVISLQSPLHHLDDVLDEFRNRTKADFNRVYDRLDDMIVLLEALGDIEVNIAGDDVNVTIELGVLERTTAQILSAVVQGNNIANDSLSEEKKGNALGEKIFEGEGSWADTMRGKLEEAEAFLDTISHVIDLIHTGFDAVSTVIQGAQQTTLGGILSSLQAGAFAAKVMESIAAAEFSVEIGAAQFAALEAELQVTASLTLDFCEYDPLGVGPIECEGAEFLEFSIDAGAFEGFTSQEVKLTPLVP